MKAPISGSARPNPLICFATWRARALARIYVDGGATIHGFLREGLIDRITVATVPVLLGSGRPLFPETGHELKLKLESSVAL